MRYVTTLGGRHRPGELYHPTDLAIDEDGNVYVYDFGNYRIQKFTAQGEFLLQWPLPEEGESISHGLIAVGKEGDVFITEGDWTRIAVYGPDGERRAAWPLPLHEGKQQGVYTMAADGDGGLYAVVSSLASSHRLIRLSRTGQELQEIWVADGERHLVPLMISSDSRGGLLVYTMHNGVLRRFSADGTPLDTRTLDAVRPTRYYFHHGQLVAAGDGIFYLIEQMEDRIHHLSAEGALLRSWGSPGTGDGQIAISVEFGAVAGSTRLGPGGNLYVADTANHRIQVFGPEGQFLRSIGKQPAPAIARARHVAVSPDGDRVYVPDGLIYVFDRDGNWITGWDTGARVTRVAVGADGSVFAYDDAGRLQWLDDKGAVHREWEVPAQHLNDLAVDSEGRVLFSAGKHLYRLDPASGLVEEVFSGQFNGLIGIDLGVQGNLYAADVGRWRVLQLGADGTVLTSIPAEARWDVTVAENGWIYVPDRKRSGILVYDPAGKLLGQWDFTGLGPGMLRHREYAALDDTGRLYASGNNSVHVYDARTVPKAAVQVRGG